MGKDRYNGGMAVRGRIGVAAVLVLLALGCTARPVAPSDSASPPLTAPSSTPAAAPTPTAAAALPLRYVALGDSLASGMGGTASYADFYRRGLKRETGREVVLTNLGRPGWTSAQLLHALRTDPRFRAAVAEADVVTWDIGGNDIITAVLRRATRTCGGEDGLRCIHDLEEAFAGRWEATIDELTALRRDDEVPLLTFDLYTPFVPPSARTDTVLDQLASMNATISASRGAGGVEVAPVADAFADGQHLISDDGLHPSPAGHRLIARLLITLGVPTSE
jgi:lysophospholipase L1-like esterase